MSNDILKKQWSHFKYNVKKQWDKLTDDDLNEIHGDAEMLSAHIQEKYKRSKDEADNEINEFTKNM
jgi:uncharacterized protein YjbJ (UPF0337 family)